jgi:ribosomal protein S18 acetylase RimI-like enzyme
MNDSAMDGADPKIIVRDASPKDIESLTNLRPPRGIHADRIEHSAARFVVAESAGKPVAFGVIHFEGDPMWQRPEQVPLVMDLYVAPKLRGKGIGSRVLRALESTARERGFSAVYLQVEPDRNPRAVALYRKLGYQSLTARPHRDLYRSVDEEGNVIEGEEMVIDMKKWLD